MSTCDTVTVRSPRLALWLTVMVWSRAPGRVLEPPLPVSGGGWPIGNVLEPFPDPDAVVPPLDPLLSFLWPNETVNGPNPTSCTVAPWMIAARITRKNSPQQILVSVLPVDFFRGGVGDPDG